MSGEDDRAQKGVAAPSCRGVGKGNPGEMDATSGKNIGKPGGRSLSKKGGCFQEGGSEGQALNVRPTNWKGGAR